MSDLGPSVAEELHRNVRFALTFKIGNSRRPLTDVERDLVARASLRPSRERRCAIPRLAIDSTHTGVNDVEVATLRKYKSTFIGD
jgi:hypothetical protein